MIILGIETSCDETAAAIVKDGQILLSNVVASSQKIHQKYGGIVPEIAARKQIEYITPVVKEALADIPKEKIDAIAVTVGPGLIGSLLVGVEFAKTLSYLWQKPIIPVNHLVGHIYGNFLIQNSKIKMQNYNLKFKIDKSSLPSLSSQPPQLPVEFPALVLIVSGGHTELVLMKDHGVFENIGGTRDDAAGEAFDKAARLLNLGYPGGPAIQKAAARGNPKAFNLPRPLFNSPDFDFSFSGLKTALFQTVGAGGKELGASLRFSSANNGAPLPPSPYPLAPTSDLAASFQQAVIDCLIHKTLKASQTYQVKSFLLAGGVAANLALRSALRSHLLRNPALSLKERGYSPQSPECSGRRGTGATSQEIAFFAPPLELCTDNAAAIASAAFFNFKPVPWQKIKVDPGLNI